MNESRLRTLLSRFDRVRALVVGDFFLDRYLVIDPVLAERSLETGLVAHQVVAISAAPGAAGTVSSNLRALGVQVTALGILGDDGEGYELRQALRASGVDDGPCVVAAGRRTPTYTKPIIPMAPDPPRELERLDIRTRTPLPGAAIDQLIARLRELAGQFDAVIVADQMPEPECGAIADRVRAALAELAERHPATWFLADSRERIGAFERLIVKPNLRECARALGLDPAGVPELELARQAGAALQRRTGKPVFVTLGSAGMLVVTATAQTHVPGVRVRGPIDIVGAGDSAMAALAAGLCADAALEEAALLGNLAAAVTIQQLGTTGTASPQQILDQWRAA